MRAHVLLPRTRALSWPLRIRHPLGWERLARCSKGDCSKENSRRASERCGLEPHLGTVTLVLPDSATSLCSLRALLIAQLMVWARESAGSFCLLCKTCSTFCFGAIRRNISSSPYGVVLAPVKLGFALLGAGAAGLAVAIAVTLPEPLAPSRSCLGPAREQAVRFRRASGVLSTGFVTAELNLQLSPARWLRARVPLRAFIHFTKT